MLSRDLWMAHRSEGWIFGNLDELESIGGGNEPTTWMTSFTRYNVDETKRDILELIDAIQKDNEP